MWRRKRKVGSASDDARKLHGNMIRVLYGDRTKSGTVTPLGTYRTSHGRTVRAPR